MAGTDHLFSQIASVGALLIISSLAVDPLSQQLVHYKVRNATGLPGTALLRIATDWWDAGSFQDTNLFGENSSQTMFQQTR